MAKLSELNPTDYKVVNTPSSGGSLKLSNLNPTDYKMVDASQPTTSGTQPSQLEAGLRGAAQGATFGFEDEFIGALAAAKGKLLEDEEQGMVDLYRKYRNLERAKNLAAQQAHPKTYLGGELAGGIGGALVTPGLTIGKGATSVLGKLAGGAATGAAYGGAAGLGTSQADLTQGEIGKVAEDVTSGAKTGAKFGAAIAAIPMLYQGGKKVVQAGKEVFVPEEVPAAYKMGKEGQPTYTKASREQAAADVANLPTEFEGPRVALQQQTGKALENLIAEGEKTGLKTPEAVSYLQQAKQQLQDLLANTTDPRTRDQINKTLSRIDEHLLGSEQKISVPTQETVESTQKVKMQTPGEQEAIEKLQQKLGKKQAESSIVGEPETAMATAPEQAAYASAEEQGILNSKGLVEGTGGQLNLPTTPQIRMVETPVGKYATLFEPESGKISSELVKPKTFTENIPTMQTVEGATQEVSAYAPGIMDTGAKTGVGAAQKAKQEIGHLIYGEPVVGGKAQKAVIDEPSVFNIVRNLTDNLKQSISKSFEKEGASTNAYREANAKYEAYKFVEEQSDKLNRLIKSGGDQAEKAKALDEFLQALKKADPQMGENWERIFQNLSERAKVTEASAMSGSTSLKGFVKGSATGLANIAGLVQKSASENLAPQAVKDIAGKTIEAGKTLTAPLGELIKKSAAKGGIEKTGTFIAISPSPEQMLQYAQSTTDPGLAKILTEGAKKDQTGRNALMYNLSQQPAYREQLKIMGAVPTTEK